jgi:hypothetical protein
LLHVGGVFGWSLKVANIPMLLAPLLGLAVLNLFNFDAMQRMKYSSLWHFVQFVAEHDEWEVVRVLRLALHQELVSPGIEGFERFGVGDIVHEHATIRSSVECAAQTLKPFLASCVPNLNVYDKGEVYLERNHPVIDHHFLGHEIRTDCGSVLLRESRIDVPISHVRNYRILIHQRRFANS